MRPPGSYVGGVQGRPCERGRGADRERRVEARAGVADVAAHSGDSLMPFVRQLDTAEAAIAYSDLVRTLAVTDSGARGIAIRPDPALAGPGGCGRYSRSDAAAWGISFEPTARPNAGGFEVARGVLYPPDTHHTLLNAASPWRLVLTREVVFPDGTIRPIEDRTLTNGQDAARFAIL